MSANVVPEIPGKTKKVARVKSLNRVINAACGTFMVFLDMSHSMPDVPDELHFTNGFSYALPQPDA